MSNMGEIIGFSLFLIGLILFFAFIVKGLFLAVHINKDSFSNNKVFTRGIWLLIVPSSQLTEKGQVSRRAAFNCLRFSIYFVLAGIVVSSGISLIVEFYA
ncbi:hypothetical protein [Simiduia aestuariiviva]|uniref:DUF3899 domain-containing protein n=1 Tax=Simiduia aestuariiviva TaxID=1510459 RepID=A0A839UK76_9GAMM|nr:hypothetical protein [Simiduia aestuariiviva]MBB3166999.1 hypothetical protein [Simiduia aestuariiviva]